MDAMFRANNTTELMYCFFTIRKKYARGVTRDGYEMVRDVVPGSWKMSSSSLVVPWS